MTLEVSSAVLTLMRAEAKHHAPREACGILLGRGNRIEQCLPTINVHPQPLSHFEIDPRALIACHKAARDGGLQVIGYYHSHPNGRAEPSAIDQQMAARDQSYWAIVAHEDDLNAHIHNKVRFYHDCEGGFVPVDPVEIDLGREHQSDLVFRHVEAESEGMGDLARSLKALLKSNRPKPVEIWASPINLHGAYLTIFVRWDRDMAMIEPQREAITEHARNWLAARRSVVPHAIEIKLEFDSQEAVDRDYGGSWFARGR
jgi:proteasome lid subunit RPN8/RPN11